MILDYDTASGFIFNAIHDKNVNLTPRSGDGVLEIPEDGGANLELRNDIIATVGRKDSAGNSKYYVVNGELHYREGWFPADES